MFIPSGVPNQIRVDMIPVFEARGKSVDVNVARGLTKTTVKAGKSKMYVLYVED